MRSRSSSRRSAASSLLKIPTPQAPMADILTQRAASRRESDRWSARERLVPRAYPRPSIECVRLQSLDGKFVDIVVASYQFSGGRSSSDHVDWDANWLMIRGKAWDG